MILPDIWSLVQSLYQGFDNPETLQISLKILHKFSSDLANNIKYSSINVNSVERIEVVCLYGALNCFYRNVQEKLHTAFLDANIISLDDLIEVIYLIGDIMFCFNNYGVFNEVFTKYNSFDLHEWPSSSSQSLTTDDHNYEETIKRVRDLVNLHEPFDKFALDLGFHKIIKFNFDDIVHNDGKLLDQESETNELLNASPPLCKKEKRLLESSLFQQRVLSERLTNLQLSVNGIQHGIDFCGANNEQSLENYFQKLSLNVKIKDEHELIFQRTRYAQSIFNLLSMYFKLIAQFIYQAAQLCNETSLDSSGEIITKTLESQFPLVFNTLKEAFLKLQTSCLLLINIKTESSLFCSKHGLTQQAMIAFSGLIETFLLLFKTTINTSVNISKMNTILYWNTVAHCLRIGSFPLFQCFYNNIDILHENDVSKTVLGGLCLVQHVLYDAMPDLSYILTKNEQQKSLLEFLWHKNERNVFRFYNQDTECFGTHLLMCCYLLLKQIEPSIIIEKDITINQTTKNCCYQGVSVIMCVMQLLCYIYNLSPPKRALSQDRNIISKIGNAIDQHTLKIIV